MAMTKWGFIYVADGVDPQRDRQEVRAGSCTTILVGVPRAEDGATIAQGLVADGAQLIELCGAFGPIHTAKVIEAIDGAVPVGAVAYGPEAVDQVHALFAD